MFRRLLNLSFGSSTAKIKPKRSPTIERLSKLFQELESSVVTRVDTLDDLSKVTKVIAIGEEIQDFSSKDDPLGIEILTGIYLSTCYDARGRYYFHKGLFDNSVISAIEKRTNLQNALNDFERIIES